MPRQVGLGMMAGGDLATTFGLGGNGLAAPDTHVAASISLLDEPDTAVAMGDAEDNSVEITEELSEFLIELEDEDTIDVELLDEEETAVEMADEV